jgi:hypothetical protein
VALVLVAAFVVLAMKAIAKVRWVAARKTTEPTMARETVVTSKKITHSPEVNREEEEEEEEEERRSHW